MPYPWADFIWEDSESAVTIWEEADCPYKAHQIRSQHSRSFFGQCITVPERYIRELEVELLNLMYDQKRNWGENVYCWHKSIDEVVAHQLKLEFKHSGPDFAAQFNVIYVVSGSDHGAHYATS